MRSSVLVLTGFVIALVGVLLGLWWAPIVAGAAIGLVLPSQRSAMSWGAAAGFVAWLLPLAGLGFRYGLGPTASSLAAIMGFGHQGSVPVVLTLLLGTLLGLAGAWLATAARSMLRPAPR